MCADVAELFLDGRKAEAAARIQASLVEKVALVGPKEKVAEELSIWKGTLLTQC